MRVRFPSPAPLRLPHGSGNHNHHPIRLTPGQCAPRWWSRISRNPFCTCRSPHASSRYLIMGWRTRRNNIRFNLSAGSGNVGVNVGLRWIQNVGRLFESQRLHEQCSRRSEPASRSRMDSWWRLHQWFRFNSLVSRKRACISRRSCCLDQLPTRCIWIPWRRKLRNT